MLTVTQLICFASLNGTTQHDACNKHSYLLNLKSMSQESVMCKRLKGFNASHSCSPPSYSMSLEVSTAAPTSRSERKLERYRHVFYTLSKKISCLFISLTVCGMFYKCAKRSFTLAVSTLQDYVINSNVASH